MRKILLLLLFVPLLANAQTDTVGIFLKYGNSIQQIFPIKSYKNKYNTLAAALTYGLASTKLKVEFRNKYSDNVATNLPEIYFYYPTIDMKNATAYALSNPNLLLGGNPNDFILVQLNPTGDHRELTYGTVNIYSGNNMGVDADKTKIKMTSIRSGVFKISFPAGIDFGEYALVYTTATGSAAYMPIYDFGVWPKNYTYKEKDNAYKEEKREQRERKEQGY
jgi:hypothetical protein